MAVFKKNIKNYQKFVNFGKNIEVRVGIVEKQTHPSGIDMAQLQLTHHYGSISRKIPARDVYNAPLEKRQSAIMARLQTASKGITSPEKLAEILGEAVLQEAVLHTFRSGEGLAINAESTVKQKGHNTPLVEDGFLMKAQSWKVVKK